MMFLLFFHHRLKAQTFSEFFSQRKTQKKYLLEQIAALKVYTGYLTKTYHIAKQGLGLINTIKAGEFGLHAIFFSRLKYVSPGIRHYTRITDILAMHYYIVSTSRNAVKQVRSSGYMQNHEQQYVSDVWNSLLEGCSENLNSLSILLTDGGLELKDDERFRRVDELYSNVLERYLFAQRFTADICRVIVERKKLSLSTMQIKSWYGYTE